MIGLDGEIGQKRYSTKRGGLIPLCPLSSFPVHFHRFIEISSFALEFMRFSIKSIRPLLWSLYLHMMVYLREVVGLSHLAHIWGPILVSDELTTLVPTSPTRSSTIEYRR